MKKGFTLVELLSIIGIIGLVSLIVFPTITSSIHNSKKKLYDIQVSDIETSAKKWATEHNDLLDQNHLNTIYLSMKTLQDAGLFEDTDVINPVNKEKMNGCTSIYYVSDTEQYAYQYEEQTCEAMATHGWIYTWNGGIWVKQEKDAILSVTEQIVSKYQNDNLLKMEGQETAGLYDMIDRYVFRGSSVNNYVKIGGASEIWRILSMDKKNRTIRLLLTTPIPNAWDTENKVIFENASVSTVQLDTYYQNKSSSIQNILPKVNINATWSVGNITTDTSYTVLKSLENGRSAFAKLGLIGLSDYVGASTNGTCHGNFQSGACKNDNYLYDLMKEKTTWTINNNDANIWVIDGTGAITTASPSSIYYIYPVVELKSNAYIKSGDGKSTSPFILE